MVLDTSAPLMEVDYKFVLDEGAKTTKLQLTFHGMNRCSTADGLLTCAFSDATKIAQKFNLSHTGDKFSFQHALISAIHVMPFLLSSLRHSYVHGDSEAIALWHNI